MSRSSFSNLVWVHKEVVVGLFWLYQAGLPPAVLGPNILSKRVETDPTATQFDPACAQTMPCLPGARLRWAERGTYPQFLP